jgi:hypothetical protein
VVTSTACKSAAVAAHRMPPLVADTSAPVCPSTSGANWSRSGRVFSSVHVGPPRHGDRHREGAGFDAVGQHLVGGAVEARHALDHDLRQPATWIFAPMAMRHISEVHDLGLAAALRSPWCRWRAWPP